MYKYLLFTITLIFGAANASDQDRIFGDGKTAFSNKDFDKAYSIWLPLASNGYVPAQDTIGYLYSNGLGVKQNHEKAVEWYKKAAEGNHLEAMFNLANAYRLGRGVPKNIELAEDLYRKSLCSGYKYSIVGLVALYSNGQLQPRSEAEESALKKDLEKLKNPEYRRQLINMSITNSSLNNSLNRTCYADALHAD